MLLNSTILSDSDVRSVIFSELIFLFAVVSIPIC
jgi:hypothetical protein